MNIRELLERIEWGQGANICPDCDIWRKSDNKDVNDHDQDCQLKAVIDALRSGRLVVVVENNKKKHMFSKLEEKEQRE